MHPLHSLIATYQRNRKEKKLKEELVRIKIYQSGNQHFENMADKKRKDENGYWTTFTPEQDEIIKAKYLTTPMKTLGRELGKSWCGINKRIQQLGLEVSQEIRNKRKVDGFFRLGTEPPNKGKPQTEWLSPEAIERCKVSRYKKGQKPHNTHNDWVEVVRNENGRFYTMLKVPNVGMVYKHIWIWEQKNGKVKKGYNVVFQNGDTQNCNIENLECISNAENMLRNSPTHDYPKELIPTYAKISQVKQKIKKLEYGKN